MNSIVRQTTTRLYRHVGATLQGDRARRSLCRRSRRENGRCAPRPRTALEAGILCLTAWSVNSPRARATVLERDSRLATPGMTDGKGPVETAPSARKQPPQLVVAFVDVETVVPGFQASVVGDPKDRYAMPNRFGGHYKTTDHSAQQTPLANCYKGEKHVHRGQLQGYDLIGYAAWCKSRSNRHACLWNTHKDLQRCTRSSPVP